MRFPQKFPYTSINNINLDWIIKRVKEALRTANEAADNVSGAIEAAAEAEASAAAAQTAAQAAQTAAEGVVDTAAEALTTAQAALTTAEGIATTANTALSTAQAAQTTANSANTTAQAAQTTAEGIASTANTALSTAQAAQTTAEEAQETAEGVESIAQAAQTTANSANTTANNANTAANNANTAARAAQTTANSKCEIHDNAITTLSTWSSQKIRNEIDSATPSGLVSYAEAQSLTDAQQNQARENIGADWILLWQNASPLSSFTAQTISVNYSAYERLMIFYNLTSSNYRQLLTGVDVSTTGGVLQRTTVDTTTAYVDTRSFNLSGGTQIVWTDCYDSRMRTGSTPVAFTIDNTSCVPYAIYGVKK